MLSQFKNKIKAHNHKNNEYLLDIFPSDLKFKIIYNLEIIFPSDLKFKIVYNLEINFFVILKISKYLLYFLFSGLFSFLNVESYLENLTCKFSKHLSQKKVMEKRRLQRSHLESLSTWLFNFLQNERIKTFSVYTSRFGQLLFLISQPWTCINFIITLTTSLFFFFYFVYP